MFETDAKAPAFLKFVEMHTIKKTRKDFKTTLHFHTIFHEFPQEPSYIPKNIQKSNMATTTNWFTNLELQSKFTH